MRVPRTIHLLGHDWRVEFVPPEKLAAIIRETSPVEADDGYFVAYWNIQHRAIWVDGTIPRGNFCDPCARVLGQLHHIIRVDVTNQKPKEEGD